MTEKKQDIVSHPPAKVCVQRVAIYCRLSEEDRDKKDPDADSRSIQNQKSMLVNYAVEQGWELYNLYSDDDYAGSDRARPEFNRLLEDASGHKFEIILCKSQSRFTREMELVEKYIHGSFLQWNIRFVGLADNADTANKGNKKARQINGLVNEWYLEDMSENVRAVLDNKRCDGEFIGSFASYGYQKDPQDKHHLIIDETAGENVRRIFTMYLQGKGPCSIARELNAEGILNPSAYKKQSNPSFKRGRSTLTAEQWSYSTIISILKKEMYIGNTVQGINEKISYKSKTLRHIPKDRQIRAEHTHEAIIDMETWIAVRAAMGERSVEQRSTGTRDILLGKCTCAYCGARMRIHYGGRANRKYLVCTTNAVNPALCNGSRIKREALAQELLREVRANVRQFMDAKLLEENLKLENPYKSCENRLEKQALELAVKLARQKEYLKTAYKDKVRGLLTDAQYIELSEEFSRDIITTESEAEKVTDKLHRLDLEKAQEQTVADIITKYAVVEELTEPIVQGLVNVILIGRAPKQRAAVPIEIKWNF